jgi:hypothetical protein
MSLLLLLVLGFMFFVAVMIIVFIALAGRGGQWARRFDDKPLPPIIPGAGTPDPALDAATQAHLHAHWNGMHLHETSIATPMPAADCSPPANCDSPPALNHFSPSSSIDCAPSPSMDCSPPSACDCSPPPG